MGIIAISMSSIIFDKHDTFIRIVDLKYFILTGQSICILFPLASYILESSLFALKRKIDFLGSIILIH